MSSVHFSRSDINATVQSSYALQFETGRWENIIVGPRQNGYCV